MTTERPDWGSLIVADDDNPHDLATAWTTATGDYMKIADMATTHIVNTLRLLHRKPSLLVARDFLSAEAFEAYSDDRDWGPCPIDQELEDLYFRHLGISADLKEGRITLPEANEALARLDARRAEYTANHATTRALQVELGRRVMDGRVMAADFYPTRREP